MLNNKQLNNIVDYLAGSCNSLSVALNVNLERDYTDEEYDQANKHIEDVDMFECEECGWWSYPGEELGPVCVLCQTK